ncbi:MAG TPA: hypothetical protein VFZ22_09265 [Pyrinomonadaceae bacterium]|nr:hypothetical protein [Pyrinomonadaceae bacterium]
MKEIDIEGYTAYEILNLPDEQLDAFVLSGRPIVFRAGSAEILGEFKIKSASLIVELAHIDGGGEGVLPALTSLAKRYAQKRGLKKVEWIVHALNCAEPNLKLRRVMERRGFEIVDVDGGGKAYYQVDEIG